MAKKGFFEWLADFGRKLFSGGKHGSLPDLALLDLTVTQQGVDPERLLLQLGGSMYRKKMYCG